MAASVATAGSPVSIRVLMAALAASVAALVAAGDCNSAISKGALKIHGKGAEPQHFLVGNGGSVEGDRILLEHNSGFSVFHSCEEEWKPEAFEQFKLLGKSMSFNVDLSKVGCACNVAFYLISAPAKDFSGKFHPGENRGGQPAYYCDANQVGGQWCPEIDIMEANNHAFQSTPHNCEAPMNGHYSYCDRGGCGESTTKHDGSFGPGVGYQIDTTKPFDVITDFLTDGNAFTGMRTTLAQSGRRVALSHDACNMAYLAMLTDALRQGMSLRITYWGVSAQDMAWLDSPPCGAESCTGDHAGDAIISNITIADIEDSSSDAHSDAPSTGGQAGGHSKWISDESAPWQCHHYTGNQQETNWCKTAGFEGGFEYKYTGGTVQLCGPCWCCKRTAKKDWSWEPAETPVVAPPAAPASTTASTTEPPSLEKGPLEIRGMDDTFLAGNGGSVDGDAITIRHNAGFTIFQGKTDHWDPDDIAEFKLLGKMISFTVDLSHVGCACNLAFYLISMPAMNLQGLPNRGHNRGGQPPFYCDANKVGGQWCPEIDIMEANNHAFQATLHRCDDPKNEHYENCDRGGCASNTRDHGDAYGPGSHNTIDTTRPFDVDTEFLEEGGVLTGMRTTLRQRGRRVVLQHLKCDKVYLAKLSEAMGHGMSLRITYWGDQAQTMAWMDVPPCDWNGCTGANAGDAVISDIRVSAASVGDGDDGAPTVWVIMDPKDQLFGEVAPRDALEGPKHFAHVKDDGVAEWDGKRHYVTRLLKSEVKAKIAALTKDRLDKGLPAPGSIECTTGPCEISLSKDKSGFMSMMLKRFSLPAPSNFIEGPKWWPLSFSLTLASVMMAVVCSAIAAKRLRPFMLRQTQAAQQKLREGETPGSTGHGRFARVLGQSPGPEEMSPGAHTVCRSGSTELLSPIRKPSARGPWQMSPTVQGEHPSPIRRALRTSLMMSPPGRSRQDVLAMMEHNAE